MPMYALATLPLINQLADEVTQIWYADDAGVCGSISALPKWWDQISSEGPDFGYYVNDSKTWLVTKDGFTSKEKEVFVNTTINITSERLPYFSVPIGTSAYCEAFISVKVASWSSELQQLTQLLKVIFMQVTPR